ncbi:MAG: ankyrin repeat domain-containing protein [Acidobacteriota bacterium]
MPKTATLSWREGESGQAFQLDFEVKKSVPESWIGRITEIEYIITGGGEGYIAFRVRTGGYLTERHIPNEDPAKKGVRDAKNELARHIRSGATSGFSPFLEKGANINPSSCLDPIPLKEAVLSGNPQTVAAILDLGAKPELPKLRFSALIQAIHVEYEDVAQLLIERGADINFKVGNDNPLTEAADKGLPKTAQRLIDKGADPNLAAGPEFPLIAGIRQGDREVVRILLEAGADPTVPFLGESLIEMARQFRQTEIEHDLNAWIDRHGLTESLTSKAETFFFKQKHFGETPTLLRADSERLKKGVYSSPDGIFNVHFPNTLGTEFEIVELWNEGSITRESRIFTDLEAVVVIIVTRIRKELPQNHQVLERVHRRMEGTFLGDVFEMSWRGQGPQTTLEYSILNEAYDHIAYPYGISSSSHVEPFTTIGVSSFFVRSGHLIQLAMILPVKENTDAVGARRYGLAVLHQVVDGISFGGDKVH